MGQRHLHGLGCQQRNELLETDDISETINAMRQSVIAEVFRAHVPAESVEEQWDMPGLERALAMLKGTEAPQPAAPSPAELQPRPLTLPSVQGE